MANSKLYFWDDRALYVGMDFITDMHSHHATQIVVGLEGEIQFRTESEKEWIECGVAFISADTLHQMSQTYKTVAVLYLDNETGDAISLKKEIFQKSPIRSFSHNTFSTLIPETRKITEDHTGCHAAFEIFKGILGQVLTTKRPRRFLDNRIEKVIETLKRTPEPSVSVSRLAESMGLSLSRLGHLFKEQTGFPIRRYFLWIKLTNAIKAFATASSLTEAAHAAGFSDSSHMNRTFKQMFGIKPSFFLNYSQFVQVINCSGDYNF